jgi:replicative superfamily II helicase
LNHDTINPKTVIEDKEKTKSNELSEIFMIEYKKLFEKQLGQLEKSNNNERIKKTQIYNLKKEYEEFLKNPKLTYVDVYRKHKDFCLNHENPMSADKIREIKKTISKKLDIDVSYTNVFLQGLKRGIGIYTKHMPSIYNIIVQKYAQTGELGYVVADDELALGINMPFRSAAILGYKDSVNFEKSNYRQMIGRAGRRGKDNQGYIIFADVDWRSLMKSELSEIQSNYVPIKNYNVLSELSNNFNDTIPNIFKYPMDNYEIEKPIQTFYDKEQEIFNLLLWKFREYNLNANSLCNSLYDFDVDMRIQFNHNSIIKVIDYLILHLFNNSEIYRNILYSIVKSGKTDDSFVNFTKTKEFMRVLKELHNTLINYSKNFMFVINHLKYTFNVLKKIILNSNDLN